MTIVDQPEVHYVYRNFRVIAGAHLVPDFLFQLLLALWMASSAASAALSCFQAKRVSVLPLNAEHVPIHYHGVASPERLRDVCLLALEQRHRCAHGNHRRLHVSRQCDGCAGSVHTLTGRATRSNLLSQSLQAPRVLQWLPSPRATVR